MTFKRKPGRPLGAKNKEDLNSLRKLLEEGFSKNRLAILNKLEALMKEGSDLNDFKWLMNLKASIEPKEITANHLGISPQQLTVVHNYVPGIDGTRNIEDADTIQPEANQSLEQTSR